MNFSRKADEDAKKKSIIFQPTRTYEFCKFCTMYEVIFSDNNLSDLTFSDLFKESYTNIHVYVIINYVCIGFTDIEL